MRLLFDNNLSPRLVEVLSDVFPDSQHVATMGLDRARDEVVWEYAQNHDFTIVTKDADFSELTLLRGSPPQIVWLRLGNCTTSQIEATIRLHAAAIAEFSESTEVKTLEIYAA